MPVVHGHLLQGTPLCFAQLDDAFHRTAFELDSLLKRPRFQTVYPEHLKMQIPDLSHPAIAHTDKVHALALSGLSEFGARAIETMDLDEMTTAMTLYCGEHKLLPDSAKSSLPAIIDVITLGDISLHRIRWGEKISFIKEPLLGYYLVILPLLGAAEAQVGRLAYQISSRKPGLFNPNLALSLEASLGFDTVVIAVKESLIEQAWIAISGRPLPGPLFFDSAVPDSAATWSYMLTSLHLAIEAGKLKGGGVERRFAEAKFSNYFLSALLTTQMHGLMKSIDFTRQDTDPLHVSRAEDYMERRFCEPISISDIALACGVPRRTLFASFKKYKGTSPMQWLIERRLIAVRVELLVRNPSTTGIREIARRYGFTHLGEFAAAYRRRFNELPSATGVIHL
jgi:AraC-like DNA-binding protein